MSWLAILKFKGDLLHRGFDITLDLSEEGKFPPVLSKEGGLPPNPTLAMQLEQWQDDYEDLSDFSRTLKPYKIQYDGSLNSLFDSCSESAKDLRATFQNWLQSSEFIKLEFHLRDILSRSDDVRLIIQSSNHQIQALPWHLWKFIDEYSNTEIAIGAPQFQYPVRSRSHTAKVSILAIFGDNRNIDVSKDFTWLTQLPQEEVEVESLLEPTHQELNEHLHQKPWDILFFAGHSDTLKDGQGIIRLNAETILTIDDLKYGLKKAIENGLQIAIFNSCSGIGLAHALEELQLPQMIVMRQAVPDRVAHEFLKYFLNSFSQGSSFYQAERAARERLQGMEKQFPCASWLPVIYQHPANIPPIWRDLRRSNATSIVRSRRRKGVAIATIFLTSIIITSLIVGLRSLGLFQPSELMAFDHLNQLKSLPHPDERLVVVTVDDADKAYQDEHNFNRMPGWSLSEQALGQLVEQLNRYNPRVIGLDILHPYPFDETTNRHLSKANFVAICKMGTDKTPKDDSTPPPGLVEEQIGFSDFPLDPDAVVRRQLLLMGEGEPCRTSRSFGLQLALQYFATKADIAGSEPIQIQKLSNGDRMLGDHLLKRLPYGAGGYQLDAAEALGYQIMLNYRYAEPESIALREILAGDVEERLASLLPNGIVLVGVDQPDQDRHNTTLQHNVPGIIVHAHMLSQILDIGLDGKRQLWWWPQWIETLWIAVWIAIGSSLAWAIRTPWKLALGTAGSIMAVYGLGWLFFMTQSGWIPVVPAIIGLVLTEGTIVAITKVFKRINILLPSRLKKASIERDGHE